MRGAVVGAVAGATLAAGAALGALLSMAQAEPGRDVAVPVPAVSPSIPVEPAPVRRPDPDTPALQPGLVYGNDTVGAGSFAVAVRVPIGWKRIDLASDEAKWVVPGNRRNTFVLRIEQVDGQRQSIDTIKAQKIADLRRITEDFQLVEETATSIQVIYVEDGLVRHGNVRWVANPDPQLDQALVEISANGRERDQPGLLDLITRVGNGIEARLQP